MNLPQKQKMILALTAFGEVCPNGPANGAQKQGQNQRQKTESHGKEKYPARGKQALGDLLQLGVGIGL